MALTPQRVLRQRLLVTLAVQNDQRGSRPVVLAAMDRAFGILWTPEDRQNPKTRPWETKWENRVSFERADMVRDGLLVEGAGGSWGLTALGRSAASSVLADAERAVEAEAFRRANMWAAVLAAGGPESVSPSLLNEVRIFRGGRGIYADGDSTRGVLGVDGVAVSFLHNGSSFADELSPGGVRYHYPKTSVPGRDAAEVSASKAAYRLGLPVFVVTTGSSESTRTVHRGYIEEFDDELSLFLVTFTGGALPPPPPELAGTPFSLTSSDDAAASWGKRRSRPNQQRFAFQVMRRYGPACAVCGMRIQAVLHAAHLRAKKDRGSDDPRNGLPLCANHHIAFDSGLWAIELETTRLVSRDSGPSLADLGISRSGLSHLAELPHPEALAHLWKQWVGPVVSTPPTVGSASTGPLPPPS